MSGKHRYSNLTKPISVRELAARHSHILPRISRRSPAAQPRPVFLSWQWQ